jgi:hypothetical protein
VVRSFCREGSRGRITSRLRKQPRVSWDRSRRIMLHGHLPRLVTMWGRSSSSANRCSFAAHCASLRTSQPTGTGLIIVIETVADEIDASARNDETCRRVMTIPGIGPIISARWSTGNGVAFGQDETFRLARPRSETEVDWRPNHPREHQLVVTAFTNKLARTAWTALVRGRSYEVRATEVTTA